MINIILYVLEYYHVKKLTSKNRLFCFKCQTKSRLVWKHTVRTGHAALGGEPHSEHSLRCLCLPRKEWKIPTFLGSSERSIGPGGAAWTLTRQWILSLLGWSLRRCSGAQTQLGNCGDAEDFPPAPGSAPSGGIRHLRGPVPAESCCWPTVRLTELCSGRIPAAGKLEE